MVIDFCGLRALNKRRGVSGWVRAVGSNNTRLKDNEFMKRHVTKKKNAEKIKKKQTFLRCDVLAYSAFSHLKAVK